MYRLKLFGGSTLDGPSGPVSGRAAQPRRVALLALLAAAGRAGCSRDKLIGLLWPDHEEERARHHLSQSLYLLRQALGQDAIVSLGDSVRLSGDHVWTDVGAFRAALTEGDREAAVELYAGPLLDGVYLRNAPGFEQWVDAERRDLGSSYSAAVEALAEEAEARGDVREAIRWWEKLRAYDPHNSAVVLRLMRSLAASGDPANAIQVARDHERLLSAEFDMPAPPEVVALANDLAISDDAGPGVARAPGASSLVSRLPPVGAGLPGRMAAGTRHTARKVLLGLAAVALLVAGWLAMSTSAVAPTSGQHSVVVLPFDNLSGDPELGGLAAFASDRVSVELYGLGFSVFDAADVELLRTGPAEGDTLETHALLTRLFEATGADHMVEGSIFAQSDAVIMECKLLSYPERELVAARSSSAPLERSAAAIVALADSLQVATAAWFGLAPEYLESYGRGRSYEAWQEVDIARRLYREFGRREEAFTHLQRALEIDSTYDAAVGLAMIWNLNLGRFWTADSLYRDLNGRADLTSDRQKWQLAVTEAVLHRDREALVRAFRDWRKRLPVRSSYVHEAGGAAIAGRWRDCIRALDAYTAAADDHAGLWVDYGNCYHMLGEYDAAVAHARQDLSRNPDDEAQRYELARSEAALGKPAEALALATSIVDDSDLSSHGDHETEMIRFSALVDLGLELRAHGHPDAGDKVLDQAVVWYQKRVNRSPTSGDRWHLARALYAAGRWEEARARFAELSAAALRNDPLLPSHNIDVSLLGYEGTLAVRLGDGSTARRIEHDLAALDRPLLWGDAEYWLATIAAVRGDRTSAVRHLTRALHLGLFAEPWGSEYPKWDYHIDPDFVGLREYKPFQDLVASRD